MSRTSMTHAEYVAAERVAAIRHEYLRGQVWAITGRCSRHGRALDTCEVPTLAAGF